MDFKTELQNLLNKYNVDTECQTPDFILTEYVVGCIERLRIANQSRQRFYGEKRRTIKIYG